MTLEEYASLLAKSEEGATVKHNQVVLKRWVVDLRSLKYPEGISKDPLKPNYYSWTYSVYRHKGKNTRDGVAYTDLQKRIDSLKVVNESVDRFLPVIPVFSGAATSAKDFISEYGVFVEAMEKLKPEAMANLADLVQNRVKFGLDQDMEKSSLLTEWFHKLAVAKGVANQVARSLLTVDIDLNVVETDDVRRIRALNERLEKKVPTSTQALFVAWLKQTQKDFLAGVLEKLENGTKPEMLNSGTMAAIAAVGGPAANAANVIQTSAKQVQKEVLRNKPQMSAPKDESVTPQQLADAASVSKEIGTTVKRSQGSKAYADMAHNTEFVCGLCPVDAGARHLIGECRHTCTRTVCKGLERHLFKTCPHQDKPKVKINKDETKNPPSNNNNNNNSSGTWQFPANSAKVCKICDGKVEHPWGQCPEIVCNVCKTKGHATSGCRLECPLLSKGEDLLKLGAPWCGPGKHLAKDCALLNLTSRRTNPLNPAASRTGVQNGTGRGRSTSMTSGKGDESHSRNNSRNRSSSKGRKS
jgi:hypothetical protein